MPKNAKDKGADETLRLGREPGRGAGFVVTSRHSSKRPKRKGRQAADTLAKSSAADPEELRRIIAADPLLSEPPKYTDPTWPGVFVEEGGGVPAFWKAGASRDWRITYTALIKRAEYATADQQKSASQQKEASKLARLLRRYLAFETPTIRRGQAAREHLKKMDRVGWQMQARAVRLDFASASQPVYVTSATVQGRVHGDRLARQIQIEKAWAAGGGRARQADLAKGKGAGAKAPGAKTNQAAVELDEKRNRIKVRDSWYDLSEDQTHMLSILLVAKGAWVGGKTIGTRPDRLRKKMPTAVQKIVATHTRHGYRLTALLPK